jgi:hypothetical protein
VFNFCLFKFWALSDSRCHVPWNSTDLLVLLRSPTSQGPARVLGRGQLKCDGTRSETRFLLSTKRTSPLKSAGLSVQSTTGSRGVRISGSNAGHTKFRGSVKGTGYLLHLPVSPSLPLPCVTVYHHVSTGVYLRNFDIPNYTTSYPIRP